MQTIKRKLYSVYGIANRQYPIPTMYHIVPTIQIKENVFWILKLFHLRFKTQKQKNSVFTGIVLQKK